MKVIEIGDNTYKLLEEIANHWNKKGEKLQKEDPTFKYLTNWDPEDVLYILTVYEHENIKKEKHENNINKIK